MTISEKNKELIKKSVSDLMHVYAKSMIPAVEPLQIFLNRLPVIFKNLVVSFDLSDTKNFSGCSLSMSGDSTYDFFDEDEEFHPLTTLANKYGFNKDEIANLRFDLLDVEFLKITDFSKCDFPSNPEVSVQLTKDEIRITLSMEFMNKTQNAIIYMAYDDERKEMGSVITLVD